MSRDTNNGRLNHYKVSIGDSSYLHYRSLFIDVESAVRAHAKGKTLDVGCGNKPYSTLFHELGCEYIGCDVAQSSDKKVDVICESTNLLFDDESFDTVFSTQVLEHVFHHQTMLAEIYRVLKPGGTVILTAPMCWEHHEVPYDFYRFTRYGLETLFKEAGFTGIKVKANGGQWALIGQMLIAGLYVSLYRKKTPLRRLFRFLFSFFKVKILLNLIFAFLDDRDFDDVSTLNHIVVAKRGL